MARHEKPDQFKEAKLFKSGGSQAVRLPKEFRLPGDRVRIRRRGSDIVLSPIPRPRPRTEAEIRAWLKTIQSPDFMEGGRDQGVLDYEPKVSFDD